MCCCGKPTINGEVGAYSWDGKHFSTRKPHAPELAEGDTLIFDEPGRCGGIDSHCHHVRVVKADSGGAHYLLVQHGGGAERIRLRCTGDMVIRSGTLAAMDSNARYWLLMTLYRVQHESAQAARDTEAARWMQAAANKNIKTRKYRGSDRVKVWIENKPPVVCFTS